MFTEKGYKPVSARVTTDRETGLSRGYGFVELGPEDDAAKAIGEFTLAIMTRGSGAISLDRAL